MKLQFLGAAQEVTGSKHLLTVGRKKILLDCGLYQGKGMETDHANRDLGFEPSDIDYIILTHAHIDHSGRIPKLYKEGYRNKIYAQKATCDLCSLMLPDSGHIQEMEVEWKNRKRMRKGEKTLPPLYTAEDAARSLELFVPLNYDEIIELSPDIHIRLNDAGHMLGSSIFEIWVKEGEKETKAVFTGDLGNNDLPLLEPPTMIESADFVVMESTYGSRLHIRNDEKAELFLKIVSETLDNGGNVVIPSFAVGRTQEILYEINKIKETRDDEEFKKRYDTLMKSPVYVDSPLAISATEVFRNNMELFDEETKHAICQGDNPLEFPGLKFTMTAEESKALNESNESSIIISASGMCEVGRIKHHLKHNLWNPKNTILFVGYQAPGTLGYNIVNGAKKVKIFGEEVAVNARVEYIEGYSGHADQEWLMNFVYSFRSQKPKHIFLIHGEPEGQEVLKDKIEDTTGIAVSIPEFGESYELKEDSIRYLKKLDEPVQYRPLRLEAIERISTLKQELKYMEKVVKKEMLVESTKDEDIEKLNEKLKELEQMIVKVLE